MCAINWLVLLEYLKVLLSWPPIALIIAIVLATRFHESVRDFFGRLTEGKFLGAELKAAIPQPTAQQREVPADDPLRSAILVPHHGGAQVDYNLLPPNLRDDDLARRQLEYTITNPGQTVVGYRQALAALKNEQLFQAIYGTQIEMLVFLKGVKAEMPLTELVQFHDKHVALVKNLSSPASLAHFMNFLVTWNVVRVAGEPNNQRYAITDNGLEFLDYIQQNYPQTWATRMW